MSDNGFGLTFRLNHHVDERYRCSYCNRIFSSLQALGGHLTTHRRQIATMRQEHAAYMEARQRGRLQEAQDGLPFVLLAPNEAFWEAYRRGHPPPQVINFMGVPDVQAEKHPLQAKNNRELILFPVVNGPGEASPDAFSSSAHTDIQASESEKGEG